MAIDFKKLLKPYEEVSISNLQKWIKIDSVYDKTTATEEKPFGEGVKIYADNGGAFLKYKINDNLAASHFLCDKLLRYQITNDLNCHKNIFKINCLVYALSQSERRSGRSFVLNPSKTARTFTDLLSEWASPAA